METIPAKTIVTRTKSAAWFGADYNMNIYRGCCHGCVYCDSRSECYRIDNFDAVRAKENALQIIRDDLRRKVKKGVIATGAMSDPYNPFEAEKKLTRNALELINAYGFGAAVATKSTLVTRDIDILKDISSHSPIIIKMTITAADDGLCRKIEPNAPPASERFEALSKLSGAGIYCGILLMPVLPFICDNHENILNIIKGAREAGVKFIYPSFGMTLRANQREHYYKKLDEKFPGLKEKYMNRYGNSYNCISPEAKALWNVFSDECRKAGLVYGMKNIISGYKKGYGDMQLKFF